MLIGSFPGGILQLSHARAALLKYRQAFVPRKHGFALRNRFFSSAETSKSFGRMHVFYRFGRWFLEEVPPGFRKFFPEKKFPNPKRPSDSGSAQNNPGSGKGKKPDGDKWQDKALVVAGTLAASFIGYMVLDSLTSSKSIESFIYHTEEITFQEFVNKYLEPGFAKSITVNNKDTAVVHLAESDVPDASRKRIFFRIGSVDSFEKNLESAQLDLGVHPREFLPIKYNSISDGNSTRDWLLILTNILPLLFLGWMITGAFNRASGGSRLGSGRNIFSVGKANPTIADKEKINVKFADVAGLDAAKQEIMEFVDFLKEPERFTKLGAKIPRGALLVGPPGTGKTLLAKATAGEASVPFYSMSGSDFIEMFVGVGPSRVRDLFAQARENSPCIIFIDEIDAVGRSRSSRNIGGNDERENTLNQLLVEMDGFSTESGVVVLAGTNRADILDDALLRPGRFDRQIYISKPDIKERQAIFMVHLAKLTLGSPPEKIAERMAALTPGFSGADIANICNEAAIIAARRKRSDVDLKEFEAAIDRVIGGLESNRSVMTPEEKKLVAYHEAGHAVAGWFLEHASPLLKVTIVPRGEGALGYAQYLPKELTLYNALQLNDTICMALGGRASEQIFLGAVSTGASDDLRKVTQIAYNQITRFGMSSKIGNIAFSDDPNQFTKPYSDATAVMIDEEARRIVSESYARTLELLTEKKDIIDKLAQRLLELETLNHDELVAVLGPRPFKPPHYAAFLESTEILAAEEKQKEKEKEQEQEQESGEIPKDATSADESSTAKEDDEVDSTPPEATSTESSAASEESIPPAKS